MDHNEFFAALNAGNVAACYLFEGEEEYTKRAALQALRERLTAGEFAAMNNATLRDPAPDALIAAAETLPFMTDRRLVVVRDCAMLSGSKPKDYDEDKAIEQLTAYLDHLPDTACIVFYVTGKADARRKLYGVLKKKATLVSFKTLDDKQLSQWIVRELKKGGRGISGADCERLWFTVGRDLNLLTGETEKLIAYSDGRDSVTAADIQAICTQSREYKVFDLATVLLSGQAKKALTMAGDMLRGGEERLYLLTLLGGQCRKMYYAAAMKKTGAGESAIASALGVPAFAVRTALQQASGYTMAQMRTMCALCVETEFRVKSGEAPEEGSLEGVMLQILAMRQRKGRC
ncbi:MAG: DNA polymerase III subunit delta [Clostridiales bacterium]|nr:DNA polymerase III subunit delta [Clostridiales bacterium]